MLSAASQNVQDVFPAVKDLSETLAVESNEGEIVMTQSHRLTRTTIGLAFVAMLLALVAIGPAEAGDEAEYRVTVYNVTDGQPQIGRFCSTKDNGCGMKNMGRGNL